MSDHVDDQFWHRAQLGCGAELAPWLRDRGSLTQRIQRRCTHFAVHGVRDGLARIALDESALLDIAPQQLAWSREVFLYADGQPVVFAHSVLAREHLRGAWSALRTLGNKPLAAVLFAHPLVERQPLHYKALRNTHTLYRRAAKALSSPPQQLWARRSLFYLHGAPLLVTEIFLPKILQLSQDEGAGLLKSGLAENKKGLHLCKPNENNIS
ncbi:MAG: chorismate lyase [Nitrosomonadales bacterium]|nr:chorismate lyase [Nitrosomonadales bacterium]